MTDIRDRAGAANGAAPLVLPILLAATFVQLLDSTIVNVAIPAIRADLRATDGQIQLVVAGYQLTFACLLLIGGRLGDRYGRRRLFFIGMIGFVVASAGCALADNGWHLVAARLAQGAASGLMFPQVLAILQVSTPPERRPKALGLYGATVGLSTVLGPVLGGLLLDTVGASWHAVFWVNVPVGLGAVALGMRFVPESRSQLARRIDLLSLPLAVGGLFLLILPLVVGRDEDWPAWSLIALAASVPMFGLFTYRQVAVDHRRVGRHARTTVSALVPPSLFGYRGFGLALVLNLLFFTGIGPFFFVFILSLQAGPHHSALAAGLATVPFAAAGAVTSKLSARISARRGPRVLLYGSLLMLTGHSLLMATLTLTDPDVSLWAFAPALVIAGSGMGLFVAPVTHVVLAGVEASDAGAASGILATVQQAGGAVGVAIVGMIFFNRLGPGRPTAESFMDALRATLWWEVGVFAGSAVLAGLLINQLRGAGRHGNRPGAKPEPVVGTMRSRADTVRVGAPGGRS